MTAYEYRVIEIIDEFSILINYGFNDGAEVGDTIRVVAEGPEIVDPETNDSLGTFDAVKSNLTIITPYENFSLCKKIKTTRTNILANPLSQFQSSTTEVKRLEVDRDSISHKKAPDDKIIKIGDRVDILD